ncbi:MAG: 50S ribosomal protein L4, partial [Candidatus Omnitrophica bacterium]|nr:50S ribosomal protein L4 [Candidatus Omnitrophota bacterium]
EKEKEVKRASRNLPRVLNVDAKSLNAFDVLNNKYLVLSEEGVKILEKKYEAKKEIK